MICKKTSEVYRKGCARALAHGSRDRPPHKIPSKRRPPEHRRHEALCKGRNATSATVLIKQADVLGEAKTMRKRSFIVCRNGARFEDGKINMVGTLIEESMARYIRECKRKSSQFNELVIHSY